jgi:hypothetical protein
MKNLVHAALISAVKSTRHAAEIAWENAAAAYCENAENQNELNAILAKANAAAAAAREALYSFENAGK